MMLSLLFLLAAAVAPAQEPTFDETTATVNVLVTDRHGKPLPSARVFAVNGQSARQGDTNSTGRIIFTNMKAGMYMLRVERDQYITFEKEFTVDGERGSVVAAISPLSSLRAPRKTPSTTKRAVVAARSR